jgi:hypothetical protein
MKKIIPFTIVALLAVFGLQAQDDNEYKEASEESQAYHSYRITESEPPYGLNKVRSLIKGIKFNDNDETEKLGSKLYQGLSLGEKFTYHMIHPESFSQICDAYPPIQDEHKKIFGQLPDLYDEYSWSDRQIAFFKANRDSVVKLLKECITKDKQIGVNFKKAIVEMNATEMIPFLITTCKSIKKDHDILTVLLLLMEKNKYPPFIASISHKKLYSEDSDYKSFLVYNQANEDLIFQRATDFYKGLKH